MKKVRKSCFMAAALGVALFCILSLPQTARAEEVSTEEKAVYTMKTNSDKYKTADGKILAEYSYQQPKLKGNSAAVEKINAALKKDYKKSLKDKETLFGYAKADENPDFSYPYTSITKCKVTYNGNGCISFFFSHDFFGGGPHPYLEQYAMTYSLETGNKLQLTDVVSGSEKAIISKIGKKCISKLRKEGYPEQIVSSAKEDLDKRGGSEFNFYLKNGKVVVFFNQYDLGMSYAAGIAPNVVLKGTY